MTQKADGSSEFRRLDAAKLGFDYIMRSLEHEDSKANRIVVAMAFITMASAVVFTYVHPIGGSWTLGITQMNWVAVFFGIYVGLVLLGTLFLMAALGPRLHIPAEWGGSSESFPPSLLFFQKIADTPREEWQSHMQTADLALLERQIEKNFIYEAHLIAQKTRYKVYMMAIGKDLYRWSFVPLMAFIVFGLAPNCILAFGLFGLFSALVLVYWGVEDGWAPERLTGSGPLSRSLLGRSLYRGAATVKARLAVGAVLLVVSVVLIILGG